MPLEAANLLAPIGGGGIKILSSFVTCSMMCGFATSTQIIVVLMSLCPIVFLMSKGLAHAMAICLTCSTRIGSRSVNAIQTIILTPELSRATKWRRLE